ncbi:ExbD/TolR family protein [Marinobacter similis]|uniref:Biopolymer transporter ExbD n=1 Tax=Marinobacter similis TaxID=1420916 RepID=W5YGY6_9GAMM|nr:biopolymer transporter ExbD [Marinobacter similis]AHI28290.1 biopolymer transporter ExbD [Marinobacter similis]
MSMASLYSRRRPRIGMTALIDVVFILLMFFMLTSSFNQWKAVDFRSPVAVENQSADAAQLVVLGVDGTLRLVASGVDIAAGAPVNAGLFESGQPVVILPEAKVSVQKIITQLERLKALGLSVTLGNVIAAETGR